MKQNSTEVSVKLKVADFKKITIRRHTRPIHPGDKGRALTEHWLVHGAGVNDVEPASAAAGNKKMRLFQK